MPWGRLDDKANGNAKLLALSDAAWRMWGCGLIFCQANLTDGFIPEQAVHTFGVRAKNKATVATELCSVLVPGKDPLWHKVEGGYLVNDYLDWNDSKADVLAERERSRARQEKFRNGKKPGDKRGSNALRDAAETRLHVPQPQVITPQPPSGGPSGRIQRPSNIVADDAVSDAAGRFLERYVVIYAKARHGAHLQLKPARDFPYALEIVSTWKDPAHVDRMAELFLLREAWKPKNEPGTIGQFKHMAPLCDAELRKHGMAPQVSRQVS